MADQISLPLCEPARSHLVRPARRRTPATVGPFERARLQHRLEVHFGSPLRRLSLTDNRVTIFSSVKHPDGLYEMRIHAAFVDAPDDVLREVARYSTARGRGGSASTSLEKVRAYFDALGLPPKKRRRDAAEPVGQTYDLRQIFDRLNARYFRNAVEATVTWSRGRRSRRKRRRRATVQLGLYVYDERLIRIHPMLDAADVPALVVEAVMHHEMVHAVLGLEGCERAHGPEFRKLEKRFVGLEEAEAWLDRNLSRLIRRAERRRS